MNINKIIIFMKTFKYAMIALVFLIAGFLLGQSYNLPFLPKISNPQGDEQNQQIAQTVTYVINYGANEISEFQDVSFAPGDTVLDLLTRLAQENNFILTTKDYDNLGVLVVKIGDKENNQDNKYWQYEVNGVQPQIGSSQYQLQSGERIEWKFEEFKSE